MEQSDRRRLVHRQAVPRGQLHEEDVVIGVPGGDQADQRRVADRLGEAPELDGEPRPPGRVPGLVQLQELGHAGRPELGPAVARRERRRGGSARSPAGGTAGDLVGDRPAVQRVEPPVAPRPRLADGLGVAGIQVERRADRVRGLDEVVRGRDGLDGAGAGVDRERLARRGLGRVEGEAAPGASPTR